MNITLNNRPEFMVDQNVGKLTKMLRLLGFDTVFFNGENDTQLVRIAQAEGRIILTRDTHILERRLVTSGEVKALLIKDDNPENQIAQVLAVFDLQNQIKPFTLCLESNVPLETRTKEEVRDRVPPYIFKTRNEFMECPRCHRIFWKGTHWEAMTRKLEKLAKSLKEDKK